MGRIYVEVRAWGVTPQDDESMRVQLARMEGKQDRLNDKVERFQADVIDLREGHHRLSNRVGVLEAHKTLTEGQKQGFTVTGKLIGWGVGLLAGTGIGAALLEAFK